METLTKQLDNHIQSLKSLNEEPNKGVVFDIIEFIKSTNFRLDSSSKVKEYKEFDDETGYYTAYSGTNDHLLCEGERFAFLGDLVPANDEGYFDFKLKEIYDEDGSEIEVNQGDMFWIEKAINENLIV